DQKRRRIFICEHLALIVSDDHHHIRLHLGKFRRHLVQRSLALIVAFLAFLRGGRPRKTRLAGRQQLRKVVHLAAIEMLRIFPIRPRAQVPHVRRSRKHRPVRRSHPEYDLRHNPNPPMRQPRTISPKPCGPYQPPASSSPTAALLKSNFPASPMRTRTAGLASDTPAAQISKLPETAP